MKWLIDRSQSRFNEMTRDSLEIDFKLKYGYLEGRCSKTQFEGIRKIFRELEELKTNLGQVYEIIPAPFEKLERRNELELFFNDIDRIIAEGKLDVTIRVIELNTQQKINEAIKNMVNTREEFIKICPEYLSMNIQHGQNVNILNKAMSKISGAYYENLEIYKNSPDFPIIKNKLNEIKVKMFLCEKYMYGYREKGFDFSAHQKSKLYELETELSVFGSQRVDGLNSIEEGFTEKRREIVEQALKKREEQKDQKDNLAEFAKRVEEVDEETTRIAEARIPIRSPHASRNEQTTR